MLRLHSGVSGYSLTFESVSFWRCSMMFDHGFVPCPACSIPIETSLSVFRLDFKCPHCGAALAVPLLYTRVLVVISGLLGYALAWKIAAPDLPQFFYDFLWKFCLLSLPTGYLVLTLLVRIAPFLVKPSLVLRPPFDVFLTSLNLSSGPMDDPKN